MEFAQKTMIGFGPHTARTAVAMGLFCLVGCQPHESPQACSGGAITPGMLALPTKWQLTAAADHPFAAEGPSGDGCDSLGLGFGPELFEGELAFFVDTGLCDPITVEQPARQRVRICDTVRLRLYRFALTAPDPGEAHVAIAFGDTIAWEQRIPIPADPFMLETTWTEGPPLSADEPIRFHVHNHGDNNWELIELSVE